MNFLNRLVATIFHFLYYRQKGWSQNTFLGYPIMQCPFDLQVYQELIFRLKPQFILQTGIWKGGSLLYFATLLDAIGAGPDALVIGVDIELLENAKTLSHPRIRLIEGSSIDASVIAQIDSIVGERRGLVILDSDHSQAHVTKELSLYERFAAVYLVIEDTNINGHPVYRGFGPGPFEAAQDFLRSQSDFREDPILVAKHGMSFHTWLKRSEAQYPLDAKSTLSPVVHVV